MPRGRPKNAAGDTDTDKATKPQKGNGNGANARHLALLCASAARQDAVRYQKCHALTETIDALAENLTGDRTYFHLKPHGGAR